MLQQNIGAINISQKDIFNTDPSGFCQIIFRNGFRVSQMFVDQTPILSFFVDALDRIDLGHESKVLLLRFENILVHMFLDDSLPNADFHRVMDDLCTAIEVRLLKHSRCVVLACGFSSQQDEPRVKYLLKALDNVNDKRKLVKYRLEVGKRMYKPSHMCR